MYYLRLIYKNGKNELHTFTNIENAKGYADASGHLLYVAYILDSPIYIGNSFYEDTKCIWHCNYLDY